MTALDNLASLRGFLPELVLCGGIVAVLALSFSRHGRRPGRGPAVAVAALTCLGAIAAALVTASPTAQGLFGGLIARDPFADFFKLLIPLSGALVCGLTLRARPEGTEDGIPTGGRPTTLAADREAPEFFALLLAVVLGAQLMAAANHLLMLYLALEFSSLASYALAGFSRRSRRSSEAALKYVVYGGVASGAMIYGLSLLYGLAGSLELGRVQAALATTTPGPIAIVGVGLCLAGLGFKVAAVPFHSWCPDVYEGAPTVVAAFLSLAPKAGGFALLLRLFSGLPASSAVTTTLGAVPWEMLALVIAVASMTLGNLAALAQRNLKRLLAYSSIAHAGYLFLGVASGAAGQKAVLVYFGAYLFATLAAFGVLIAVADEAASVGDGAGALDAASATESLPAWAGLSQRAPFFAFVMAVTLFSLAGLPPTAGFIGKYYLFSALVAAGRATGNSMYLVAALLAVMNTVISLAYYLRIVRAMYLNPAPASSPAASMSTRGRVQLRGRFLPVLLGGMLFFTVALGLYWSPLDALATASATLTLSPSPIP